MNIIPTKLTSKVLINIFGNFFISSKRFLRAWHNGHASFVARDLSCLRALSQILSYSVCARNHDTILLIVLANI